TDAGNGQPGRGWPRPRPEARGPCSGNRARRRNRYTRVRLRPRCERPRPARRRAAVWRRPRRRIARVRRARDRSRFALGPTFAESTTLWLEAPRVDRLRPRPGEHALRLEIHLERL